MITQSSQNVLVAGHLTTYNEISAAYFTLVRLVFKTRLFRVVVHHCKVQSILLKYFHFSYDVIPLITTFQLDTASLHRFSGDKVSSKLLVQIVSKYITQTRAAHDRFCRNVLNIMCSWRGKESGGRSVVMVIAGTNKMVSKQSLLPITIASLPTTQKHFDRAVTDWMFIIFLFHQHIFGVSFG